MNTIARYGVALALVGAVGAGAGLTYQSLERGQSAAVAPAATSPADAVRLAKQATFGPNKTVVARIQEIGATAWVDEQLELTDSTYADMTTGKYAQPNCDGASDVHLCIQTYFRAQPVAMRFYSNALSKPDQLRQRVAFALSQMIVTSGMKVERTAGIASFQQIMLSNAFGNYETILREVTLNPAMGDYLDMATSVKGAPNQNYARELMQIFSIYPSTLNPDGTLRVSNGQTTPTYTEEDVNEVARALTGWTYARYGAGVWHERKPNYAVRMVQYPAGYAYFDDGAKSFLGRSVPAGASPEANLNAVIGAVFNHPNVGPYVARQLIQHLVTSNPRGEYVERVASVFNDNGRGVRGDLKAVVRAILLDPDARGGQSNNPSFGKVKEPVLHITSFLRVMNATSDGFFAYSKAHDLNQRVFEAPSVFNYYPWDFPLAQSDGLVSPSSKLTGAALDHERHNFVFNYTLIDDILGTGRDYNPIPSLGSRTGTKVDWKQWEAYGDKTDDMIKQMDLILLGNTMTPAQYDAIKAAMEGITDSDRAVRARKRAQTGLYIILTSPQFQVDR
ncbi:DUF1800 domain-containing protein [Caulobacter sp. NIBR2454]|uniref:DUF1800 domain-containing protein n=1 Tax=Caulobacter sp. NIBR2454 TaxID=3015996 RepID=UPI0022B71FEE|nr:DUF1800 domain-containing protein [Caulobacter sp. NIBR2454]